MASRQVKQLQIAEKEIIKQILNEQSNVLNDYLLNHNKQQVIEWQKATNRKYGAVMFELGTEIFQTYRQEAGFERYEWIFHDEVMEQVLREANRQGYASTWKGLVEEFDIAWLQDNYENNIRAWGRNAGLNMSRADGKCIGFYLVPSPSACDFCKDVSGMNAGTYKGLRIYNNETTFHTHCRCSWQPAFRDGKSISRGYNGSYNWNGKYQPVLF